MTLGDENIQQRILGVMFDLLVDNKNPACSQTVGSVFKAVRGVASFSCSVLFVGLRVMVLFLF